VGIDEVGRGPLAGPVVACAAVLKSPDALLTLNDSKKLSRPKREAMFEDVKDACVCYAIASASVEEIDEMNILEADFLAMRRALQALGFPGLNETAPEIPIEVKGSLKDAAIVILTPQAQRSSEVSKTVILNNAANDAMKNVILNEAQRNEGSSNGFPNILVAVDGNLKIDKMPQDIQMPIVKGDGRIASISAASILAKVFRDRYMDKLEELYPGYGFDKHAGYGTKAHLDAIRRQGFTPAHRKSFHPKSL
jgi:ribonuclease HII